MPSSADPRSVPAGLTQVVALGPDDFPVWLAVLLSEDGQDPPPVVLPEAAATERVGDAWLTRARLGEVGQVTAIEVSALVAPKAPPMWFAEVPETGPPRALNLVAFAGFDVEPGSVLDMAAQLEVRGLSGEQQIGAIRWYPDTGEMDQAYVAPDWRRRSIATALMGACATYNLAIGKPMGWGDGQRTAMGEKWRNSHGWGHRAADLEALAPPMTPPDQR
ncbi:GNAT family N-acetyltransferase [Aeromicrobium sp. Leaf350]|uniref:GNAT family N-acetyltransferase n=1 Tax=Aeromicrobium sp. Leaf350 TaxID=2876565 RepID=UPI001E419478|nr:GNAT family N-acetyltransferase [Aeromicrobium sp. Leaf350]